jgi:hypothetical protein
LIIATKGKLGRAKEAVDIHAGDLMQAMTEEPKKNSGSRLLIFVRPTKPDTDDQ